MGDSIAKEEFKLDEQLLNTRLCWDLSENIHLHYRDLRLEFSVDEWKEFSSLVHNLDSVLAENQYVEGTEHFKDFGTTISPEPKYFPNRLRLELLRNGTYHLHYNNFRLELTYDNLDTIRIGILKILGIDVVDVDDIRVVILSKEMRKKKKSKTSWWWRNIQIKESPNYLALSLCNYDIHTNYANSIIEFDKGTTTTTTEQYIELIEKIDKEGMDFNTNPIRISFEETKNQWIVQDGHHRICYLIFKYNISKFLIRNNTVIGII